MELNSELSPRPSRPLRIPRQAWMENSEGVSEVRQSSLGSDHVLSPPVLQTRDNLSIERTPESSNVDEFVEESSSDRVKSPSASSVSSKRTSMSAEFSAQIRQKIRQQAKSMVQKKRGSVQLAKRLLRSQTLTEASEQEVDLGDQEAIDRQLEESIRAGKRFSLSEKTPQAPESLQKKFFEFSSPTKQEKQDQQPTRVFFTRSLARSQKDMDKFKSMLVTYGKKGLDEIIEDPFSSRNALFSAAPERDFSVFFQRQGASYPTSKEAIIRLNGIITDKPLRIDRDAIEDFGMAEYQKAVNWNDWDVHSKRHTEYFTMDLDLNRIEFDHHWLFTREDKLVRKVKSFHHEITQVGSRILDIGDELESFKETTGMKVLSESQRLDSLVKLKEFQNGLEEAREEYKKLSAEIDKAWEELKDERERSKTSSTKLVLKKLFLPEAQEHWQSSFEEIPLYFIEDPEEKDQKASKDLLQKVKIQVFIFFNDIPVCKTSAIPMQSDFSVSFRKVFQMRIYEPPSEVYLIVREFQPVKGWVELGKVYLPLPESKGDQSDGLNSVEFGSDVVVEKTPRYLGCGLANNESPNLSGIVFYNLKWIYGTVRGFQHLSQRQKKEEEDLPFELIPSELRLTTDEEFQHDIRLDALTKRFSGSVVFKNEQKRIGMNPAEVDSFWIIDDTRDHEFLSGLEFSMDAMRRSGNRYAAMIRNQLVETFAHDHRLKTFHDVVREVELPSTFSGFGSLFGPVDLSRKLKPMRVPAKRTQTSTNYLKLVIGIQSASNLPERMEKSSMHVLVECQFQENKTQTLTVNGRNANWQQTLIINMPLPSDGPLDLRTITDHLNLTLYDQHVRKLPHDDREPNSIHKQIERRWLGSAAIPFSTIYSLGKVDGVIAVKEPLFSSEYRLLKHHSFLKVMITLDPPIIPPAVSTYENFLPSEPPSVLAECEKFYSRNKQLFPDRRLVALVNNTFGNRVLSIRYIRPLMPPHHIQELLTNSGNPVAAIQLAAHMVSCIPFVADPIMFPGVCDLWATAEQLLTIGCGDGEEHAILLLCWLLQLDLSAVLLLGTALPEGPKGAYILVELPQGSPLLVNATDGNVYSINDSMCPLISVGTAITADNVYANIQKNSHPSTMDFDLKNKSNWDPLFTTPRHDFTSVQPSSLTYTAVNEDILVELRSNLEREIKLKFDEARPYAIPQWNLMASRALREILIEYDTAHVVDIDVEHRLGTLMNSYKVSAVGFRCAYESRQKLIDQVLRTNIHININKNAQFALSVHIQPFVNNIISCSIAVASLVPKFS
ncbi:hypothetical protein FO519_000501 [Halicephalobus sp. NKZ332]|nr:hypothetical protein FO519_000501 [Halicephalobus sp. NKZ332]